MTETQRDADAREIRDELPADLDVTGFVGPYKFPDNSRRRIPGLMYLVIAAGCLALWLARRGDDPVLVNDGFLAAAVLLGAVGTYCLTSGWRMQVDERQALVAATRAAGFPVGHASAQLAWRGLRSRPTWRILCYSTEEPPRTRAFVLVDAVDGHVVEQVVEDNPEGPEAWAPLVGGSAVDATDDAPETVLRESRVAGQPSAPGDPRTGRGEPPQP